MTPPWRRAKTLGIPSVPAMVIDGKVAECCAGRGPEEATLRAQVLTDVTQEIAPREAAEHDHQSEGGKCGPQHAVELVARVQKDQDGSDLGGVNMPRE